MKKFTPNSIYNYPMRKYARDAQARTEGILKFPEAAQEEKKAELRETNDCVVVAFAEATGSGYENAHEFCAKAYNRQNRQGTRGLIHTTDLMIKDGAFKKGGDGFKLLKRELIRMPSEAIHTVYKLNQHNEPDRYSRDSWKHNVDREKGIRIRQMTIKTFLEKYPKGRYVIAVAGHALAVVDGVIRDHSFQDRRRVQAAWKVVEK